MTRHDSLTGLRRYGHSLQTVKEWRQREHKAGRPSGFDDFLRAYDLCTECGATGEKIVGCTWRDSNGAKHSRLLAQPRPVPVEQIERETIAALFDHDLKDALDWEYLTETCEICGGTGKSKGS